MKTFMDMVKDGDCLVDQIEPLFDVWHNTYNVKDELIDFLGLTPREYDMVINDITGFWKEYYGANNGA